MQIALDAMGGDYAPENIIHGAVLALREYESISKLYLTGDTRRIEVELKKHDCNDRRIEIVHTTQVVDMDDSGLSAVRKKKDSSVSRAVELVKEGKAQAIVSAGHTGAAVTASIIKLRTLPGVDRPAIASIMPSFAKYWILIDAGANPDAEPAHLFQNALMGAAYARHVLGRENPEVGLMSNGTEEEKGNALCKEARTLFRNAPDEINFRGNVEGHDIWHNPPDVVVTDGFTGNILLKSSEALAHAIFDMVRTEIRAGMITKLGALLAKPAFKRVHAKTNADEYGGMPLLGLNGITIIAHGGASPRAIKNAIRMACESIQHEVNPHIIAAIKLHHDSITAAPHANAPA
jgi:glycerol-3-phosphate acyltransferase PlsX